MNLQQCANINNALISIDTSLKSTLDEVNNLCGCLKDFEEQKDIVTAAYISINDAKQSLVDLRNTPLSIKVSNDANIAEDSEIIQKLLNSNDWKDRLAVAKLGFHLDRLKDDEGVDVRRAVALQGAYLDELKDDSHWLVRREVAYQGAYLDELKNDPDWSVRDAARQKLKELEEQENNND